MLELAGHRVECVLSGLELLQALKNRHYDLLVLDCLMPLLDGFEVARMIRAGKVADCNTGIPILAVTALSSQLDRQRCLDAGMTGYCGKPVKARELYAWIDQQFGKPAQADSPAAGEPDGRQSKPLTPDTDEAFGEHQAELARKMSSILLRDAAEWQVLLGDMQQANDITGLGLLAHKIRGTADLLGFQDLSVSAARLEASGKAGDAIETPKNIPPVVTALRQLVKWVQDNT
jgi:two-component system sensor histidine kinase EvgS